MSSAAESRSVRLSSAATSLFCDGFPELTCTCMNDAPTVQFGHESSTWLKEGNLFLAGSWKGVQYACCEDAADGPALVRTG